MAIVNEKKLILIINEISKLVETLKQGDEVDKKRLGIIKYEETLKEVPVGIDGTFDGAKWEELEEDMQQDIYRRLSFVLNTLRDAAGFDGPHDPRHLMYNEYASRASIIWLCIIGFVLCGGLLFFTVQLWDDATRTLGNGNRETTDSRETDTVGAVDIKETDETEQPEINPPESTVLIMVIILGALGGTLHYIRSLVMFIGNREFKRSWIPYYLSMPFIGAGLAPAVYMLLRIGLISPAGTEGNGSVLSNLNLVAVYAFSLLTGLFARTALDKLSEVFKTLFRTQEPKPKDPLEPGQNTGV